MFGPDPEARRMASVTPRGEAPKGGAGCAVVAAAAVLLAGVAFGLKRCSSDSEAAKDSGRITAPAPESAPMPSASEVIKRNP